MSTNYDNIKTNLESAASNEFVEEYEVGSGKRRVKRGPIKDQVNSMLRLEGLVARRASGGLLKLAKFKEPSD